MADGEATKAAIEEIITTPTGHNPHLDIWDRGEFDVNIFLLLYIVGASIAFCG